MSGVFFMTMERDDEWDLRGRMRYAPTGPR